MFPPNLSPKLTADGVRELQLRRRAWIDYLLALAGATRADVQRTAKVSQPTVSRALDGSRPTAPEGGPTARVWDAIAELTGVPVEILRVPPEWNGVVVVTAAEPWRSPNEPAAHG